MCNNKKIKPEELSTPINSCPAPNPSLLLTVGPTTTSYQLCCVTVLLQLKTDSFICSHNSLVYM